MITDNLIIKCTYDALNSYLSKRNINSHHHDGGTHNNMNNRSNLGVFNSRYYGYVQINKPSFIFQFTVSDDTPHGLEIVAAVYDSVRTPQTWAVFESLKDLKFFRTTTGMVAFFTFKVADPRCFQNIYELINNRKFRK